MDKITIKDIRALEPCYDPSKYLSENWTGTVEDILLLEECPAEDRIWVAVRLVPRFIAECFAIDCATRTDCADAYAAYAAAYAAKAADAYAAYADALKQERENQINALLMLLEGE
jgi:hypothetical protein